ncbi:hypothetical protein ABTD98_22625, partial [Acinetobacter baumannii]
VQYAADSAWAISLGLVDEEVAEAADPSSPDDPALLLERLEHRAAARHRATAAEYDLIFRVLQEAADDPAPWVGPDPTLD